MAWPIIHGMHESSEYATYHSARNRCVNPNDGRYADYGGRGIKFLFTSFEEFYEHIGPRPEDRSLDRIDNDGHYEIGNVKWSTSEEQAANRRKRKPNRFCSDETRRKRSEIMKARYRDPNERIKTGILSKLSWDRRKDYL